MITVLDIADQLDDDREFARALGQAGPAVSATMGKAKVLGLMVERHEHTGKDGGAIEHKDVSAIDIFESRIASIAARGGAQGVPSKPH